VGPAPTSRNRLTNRGLTVREAADRLARDGRNILPSAGRPHPVREFLAQLTHLLAVLLWVAAGLALLAGMPPLAVAIVVIVVLNAGFAFWQEHRADRSTERLRSLLPQVAQVVRDGSTRSVDVSELVVGDTVLLTAGDRVGADMVIQAREGLALDESMVTGESGAVPRAAGDGVMAGTFVVEGEGVATVTATGAATTVAGISALAGSAVRPPSPMARQLAHVVRVVAVVAFVTGTGLGLTALALGLDGTSAFLFGVGVAVALVPEGLLPTVTLSLAGGAQEMAKRNALVRRLDAVETLGATTFICTDKTGTITQNRMAVVEVLTRSGLVTVHGVGYQPVATLAGPPEARSEAGQVAAAALRCVTGRVERHGHEWVPRGDPLEAAIHCLGLRTGVDIDSAEPDRRPYTATRMLSSARVDGEVSVLGAPERLLARCTDVPGTVHGVLEQLTSQGRRVLAVGTRQWTSTDGEDRREADLHFLGLLALEDPPRENVAASLQACRDAGIRVAMLTGDHPGTAAAIAREVGLIGPGGLVVVGSSLPDDDAALALLLDRPEGCVVARVTPDDKFRIARALRDGGHVVAMTGDGVNDVPALREADVGVAMGASGSDVARESADLVLLDDHVGTIVSAVEQGRATFQNVRRFLTYHLTDNVAELTPFALWAGTGGSFPLAIGVLQVLALDIGTDMLPALALGAEPSRPGIMRGHHPRAILDRPVLTRAFGLLGPVEAIFSMAAFTLVLVTGGWTWGSEPPASLLAQASGTAFAAIALGQVANAFACRSTSVPVWRLDLLGNRLVLWAVAAELVLLAVFLGWAPLAGLLGGAWPGAAGWAYAASTAVAVLVADGVTKEVRARRAHEPARLGGAVR
jgi:magnesium-transporting ATPase (P-type)